MLWSAIHTLLNGKVCFCLIFQSTRTCSKFSQHATQCWSWRHRFSCQDGVVLIKDGAAETNQNKEFIPVSRSWRCKFSCAIDDGSISRQFDARSVVYFWVSGLERAGIHLCFVEMASKTCQKYTSWHLWQSQKYLLWFQCPCSGADRFCYIETSWSTVSFANTVCHFCNGFSLVQPGIHSDFLSSQLYHQCIPALCFGVLIVDWCMAIGNPGLMRFWRLCVFL